MNLNQIVAIPAFVIGVITGCVLWYRGRSAPVIFFGTIGTALFALVILTLLVQ